MNCAEIEILICDYVDGTLPAAEKAAVERHLATCDACARYAMSPCMPRASQLAYSS